MAYIAGADDKQFQEFKAGARQIRVSDKPVKLLRVSPSQIDFSQVDAVFISREFSEQVSSLADKGRRTNTLLLTDGSSDRRSFMINIYRHSDSTIKFEVNRSNIVYERLNLSRDVLLLGGTELDIAEMFREAELEFQDLKTDLVVKRSSLNKLEGELKQKDQELRSKSSQLQSKSRELQDKREELKQKSDELLEKEARIASQQEVIEEKETHLGRLSTDLDLVAELLAARQSDLKASEEKLGARAQELEQREETLAQQQRAIEDNSSLIEEQEVLIASQLASLEQKDSTIGMQRNLLWVLAIAAFIFLVLILYSMRINRLRQKANEQLTAMHADLEKAKEEADEASAAKGRFLAKMSHEIRTPMSGVLGMSELLSHLNLDEEQQRCNDVISSSGNVLLAIINDILDYSKIEAGKMELESVPFELDALLTDVVSMFRFRSRETGLMLMVDVADDVPQAFVGDPTRVRQILINFISNAFKFTHEGQIVIHVEKHGQDLKLAVQDSGIGIPEDARERLFEAFAQADVSTSRQYGGTGLGLSICQQLTELMGGTIGVDSEEGKGTTFWVRLPLDIATVESARMEPALDGRKLLLLEDNVIYGELFQRYAKAAGIEVQVVHTAAQADALLQQTDRLRFDAIVSDYDLSDDDGAAFLNRVQNDYTGTRVLITASSNKPDLPVGPQENIQLIADKPFVVSDVHFLLKRIFISKQEGGSAQGSIAQESTAEGNAEAAARSVGFPVMNILVAEDNSVIRMVMKGLLSKLSLEAVFAENGQEAVDQFTHAEAPFDIVFMDCEMPVMGGLEASERIRNWEREQGVEPTPIVALTAHVLGEEMEKCLQAGMDAVLNKPVKFEMLKDTLLQYVGEDA